MNEYLEKIRKPVNTPLKRIIINSILIIMLGIILGIISKWLDNLSIDNTIWWNNVINSLDLGNFFSRMSIWLFIALTISIYSKNPLIAGLNVFSFFIGMTVSYHLYTITYSGFNPQNYMNIWYGLTIISPIIAFICWYAKGDHLISIIIDSIILFIMFKCCFSIGLFYFDLKSILDLIVFICSCIILYNNPKNSLISLSIGLIFSFIINLPFID